MVFLFRSNEAVCPIVDGGEGAMGEPQATIVYAILSFRMASFQSLVYFVFFYDI